MDSFSHNKTQLKSHNFEQTLPAVHSDYANEVFKDHYNLGFLGITEPVKELELEKRLTEKNQVVYFGIGQRFYVHRQPTPLGIQQQRVFRGHAFLSSQFEPLN
ncbi:MAG: hypothetical protein QM642_03610 [Edaphocola sp.]